MKDLDVDLSSLRMFLAIVRTKGFTQAASEVHLSQSAVSRRVKQMETALGTRLFERLRGRVHLTAAGQVLVREAEQILLHADDARQRLLDIESGASGELRVGATVTAANYLFPGLLARYRRRHPGIRLVLRPSSTEKLLAMIRRNELDVAAVGDTLPPENVRTWGFIRDQLVIAAPPDHPLAGRRNVSPERLSREDFILRDPTSGTRRMLEEWARSTGVSLRILMDVW